jgi:hypothetical protein
VIDLAYLVGSALFFALMLAYVRGCDRLGRSGFQESARAEEPRS